MNLGEWKDTVRWVLVDSPVIVAQGALTTASSVIKGAGHLVPSLLPPPKEPQIIKVPMEQPLFKLAGTSSVFLRFAGLSGALAVGLGAYGAHTILNNEERTDHNKRVFETANKYHFFHSIALLGVPLCHYPLLTGTLFVAGMLFFSGSCYYLSITEKDNPAVRRLTPFGGMCLIFGWLSMVL